MSEEIKNFDRAIEQMMNESSVAPPFGMWNRISAELDAEELPVAATQAPVSFPGKAVIGFAAAAIILGISVVSFYFSGSLQNQSLTNTPTETASSAVTTDVNEIAPVNSISTSVLQTGEKTASISVAKEKPADMVNYMSTNLSEASVVIPVKEEIPAVTVISIPQETATAEIAMTDSYTADANDYFFPPIDINVGQLAATEDSKQGKENLEEDKTSEKKVKVSSSSDRRIKFKKKKSKGFTYGRLNRLKK